MINSGLELASILAAPFNFESITRMIHFHCNIEGFVTSIDANTSSTALINLASSSSLPLNGGIN